MWTEIPAKDFCSSVRDGTHDSPKPVESGRHLITSRHIIGGQIDLSNAYLISNDDFEAINKRSKVDRWDVLISMIGTVGEPCLVSEEPEFAIKNIGLFKTKSELDGRWLYYYLTSPQAQSLIRQHSRGTTQAYVPLGALRDFPVRVPNDREIMQAITNVLGTLDDKIDLNRRINQTLEQMAQAIFKSWFVDFEPVKAKISAIQEGRDPLRAAMSAISGKTDAELDQFPPEQYQQLATTAALFPDEMVDSELGEIPKGWSVNQISQFGDVVCGKTPSKANPEYFGTGIPFIKIPDMHNNIYVIRPSERLTTLGAASQAKKTIPSGSICVSCIATVGKVVITHELSQTNQQINSIVPKYAQYTAYLYFQMKEKEKEFHDLASGGSATLNMNTSTFAKVSVLMPSFEILTKFSVFVTPLFSEILLRQNESATLSETRDTLLPKLLSGELDVSKLDQYIR